MSIDKDLRELWQAQMNRANGLLKLIPPEVEAIKARWDITYDEQGRAAKIEMKLRKRRGKRIKTHRLVITPKYPAEPTERQNEHHYPQGYEARFEPPVPTRLVQERDGWKTMYREGFSIVGEKPEEGKFSVGGATIPLAMVGKGKSQFEDLGCIAKATVDYETVSPYSNTISKLLEFCRLEEK